MITRDRFLRLCLLFAGLSLLLTVVEPSVLGQAIGEHFEDTVEKNAGEVLQHEKQKGEKLSQEESGLSDNHKSQYSDAKDAGTYLKKDSDTKAHDETDSYEGQKYKQDKAEDSEQVGYKKGHKKGHQKQGFHNSYHKDESSNKSTFFDDFNDEADQAGFNSRHNKHDDKGGRTYQGSNRDANEYARNNYNAGAYNRHGGVGNKHHGRNNFDRNKYLNDRLNYNKYNKGHNAYNRGQHYGRDGIDHGGFGHGDNAPHYKGGFDNYGGGHRDWGGPGYYGDDGFRHEGGYGYGPDHGYGYGQDYFDESRDLPIRDLPNRDLPIRDLPRDLPIQDLPIAADNVGDPPIVAHRRQTITIYEDPRYEDASTGQLRRDNGDHGVQLEVRPSGQRYARYDDTYYAPRHGGVESSKINRLVYNYRRE